MPVQMTVKVHDADLVRQWLQDLAAEVPRIGRKGIYDMMLGVRKVMRTPGKKPTYPINWDSDKQRRFVLAMLRAKNNLPYKRTDGLPRGWTIESVSNGYKLYNPAKAAVYLYGNFEGARQSAIHKSRHPVVQEVVEAGVRSLPGDIEKNIGYYARKKGF